MSAPARAAWTGRTPVYGAKPSKKPYGAVMARRVQALSRCAICTAEIASLQAEAKGFFSTLGAQGGCAASSRYYGERHGHVRDARERGPAGAATLNRPRGEPSRSLHVGQRALIAATAAISRHDAR